MKPTQHFIVTTTNTQLLSQSGKSHDLSGLQKSINETINFIHVDNHK